MVKLFKTSEPLVLLVLALYAVMLHFNLYLTPPTVELQATAPLSQWLLNLLHRLSGGSATILVTVHIGLVLLQAILFNAIINHHRLLPNFNFLPALCYVLLLALFNDHLLLSPPFFANFALLFALDKIYDSSIEESYLHAFDAGFAVGVASLFYLPSAVLLLFVSISLNVHRVFNWREFVITFLGAFVPYYLIATGYFFYSQLTEFANTHFLNVTSSITNVVWNTSELLVKIALLGGVVLLSLFFLQASYYKSIVKVRKNLTVLMYLLSVSLLVFLFIEKFSLAPLALPIIALAGLFAYALSEIEEDRLTEGIHLATLMVLLFFQYFSPA